MRESGRGLTKFAILTVLILSLPFVTSDPIHAAGQTISSCPSKDVGRTKIINKITYTCNPTPNGKYVWVAESARSKNGTKGTNPVPGSIIKVPQSGAPCKTQTPLLLFPMDTSLTFFTPLGNVNPPGHIVPSGHGGISVPFTQGSPGTGSSGDGHIPAVLDVKLPAAISKFSEISRTQIVKTDGSIEDDYALTFNVCGSINIELGHIEAIPSSLIKAISLLDSKKKCQDASNVDARAGAGRKITMCFFEDVPFIAKAGDFIGKSGAGPGLDFGAIDFSKPAKLASFNLYPPNGDATYPVCALDLFPPSIRNSIKAPEGCGSSIWDHTGTAQGSWFAENSPDAVLQQRVVSLVPLSLFPGTFALVVGQDVPDGLMKNALYIIDTDPSSIVAGSPKCISGKSQTGLNISIEVSVTSSGNLEKLNLSDCQGSTGVSFERTIKLGP